MKRKESKPEREIRKRAVDRQEMLRLFLAIEGKYFFWCLSEAIKAPFKAARAAWKESRNG